MPKAAKYRLLIRFTAFCLCLLLFAPITKTDQSQDEPEIQTLINELKDGSKYVRRDAAKALGEIGPEAKTAVPALIEALKDGSKYDRRHVVRALGDIGPEAKAAVPALIEVFKDEDHNNSWAAAKALGIIGRAAVPPLLEALKDEDEVVRWHAAVALGNIGPAAEAAVPALIEALERENNKVRRQAAMALGKIGPEAKAAVPALIEVLKYKDEHVPRLAAWALGRIGPEAKTAVPALFEALKDENKEVARAAAKAMENIGRVEVLVLIEALKDKSVFVRRYAANILGDIGSEAKAAVPALTEALKDPITSVRKAAAMNLGKIGPEAKAAVPALIEALKDEDKNFRQRVAWTLAKIATDLHDAKATDMIKDLKTAKEALSAYPEFREQEKEVGRAVEYLEQINPPWWENIPKWIFKNKFKSSLILAYLLWVIAWLIVFLLRPRALLRINHALSGLDFKLPDQIGGTALPVRVLLFVGFLSYRPRTLDAWVKKYILTCREKFSEKPTVYDRQIHINVPVEFDRQTIPDLTPKSLRPVFAKRISCLLIWGEGGSGKTSLACQIAKWAMAEDKDCRPCDHLMLPVLIEQELSSGKDQSAFIHAVGRQLQDVTDQANPIPDELLERLLRYQRILVIVDHLSEMNDQTRKLIDPAQIGFPVNALLVTSRLEENLGQVSKTAIKPLRVEKFINCHFDS